MSIVKEIRGLQALGNETDGACTLTSKKIEKRLIEGFFPSDVITNPRFR